MQTTLEFFPRRAFFHLLILEQFLKRVFFAVGVSWLETWLTACCRSIPSQTSMKESLSWIPAETMRSTNGMTMVTSRYIGLHDETISHGDVSFTVPAAMIRGQHGVEVGQLYCISLLPMSAFVGYLIGSNEKSKACQQGNVCYLAKRCLVCSLFNTSFIYFWVFSVM